MDSSELFSHLQTPQVFAPDARSSEPVQAPVFSDAPRRKTPGDSAAS
ncbi:MULTISPECIES: hypothetical protein [Mycolicibacterium]|uniref:Uncharacterized protein n=2 Tax=Mycolicibacterium gilvum TaxID=1804 RepID=E6TCU8_MYCSR|nr:MULTISPECIES: hypothetical protein [Mycolicibacterium]ADT97536.1 hypothetical protein Mspyr1_08380 [Mycolicibacterium gilvum Spyr1]MBV5246111.1 hypothetical protein [Mycolicibacterium sp. PAM1]MCV7057117.1 hypothetical protein [Mycolicibacterium gilvum]STZ41744.1 Uncharacterised protein [Mycolicibacterium gilvum]